MNWSDFTTRLPTGVDLLSLLESTYHVTPDEHRIDRTLFDRLLQLNPEKALTEYDAHQPVYQQVLDRATQLDKGKSPGHLMESNGLMRLLLAAFLTEHTHPQTHNTLRGLERFDRVLVYIEEHLHTHITLRDLAEHLDLSPTYFSNLFSRLMGTTPIQYINKRRVEAIQIRLLSTHDSLKKIAEDMGFVDEYYLLLLISCLPIWYDGGTPPDRVWPFDRDPTLE